VGGISHRQYLDEPDHVVEYMLRIDDIAIEQTKPPG
jgi:hypothetical protein